MEFTSIPFLFWFFPLFLFVYFINKNRKYRNFILFLFSIIFYAWGEPIYVLLVLFSIILNYYLAKKIDKTHSKPIFIITIIIDILILVIFKYVPFLIESINDIFNITIKVPNIKLPIGISFYTFQILSYIIDIYHQKVHFQKNIIYLGCYIIAFPQLIAGPIVRYSTVEDEIDNRKENKEDFIYGTERFVIGLIKKIMIANVLGLISTNIFNQDAETYGLLYSWLGMIFYSFQILFDFSGYSDMAIGIGRMLGFHYLENFNYPYISTSITDFWRRWHISLSSFFRDYVYIPLGGNRVTKKRHILNLLIVCSLTGLWHGASTNFILWGLYYGIILIIEKYIIKDRIDKWPNTIKHLYSLLIIIIGWVLFKFTDMLEIKNVLGSMFGINGLGNIHLLKFINGLNLTTIIALILAIIFAIPKLAKKFLNFKYKDIILIILLIISLCEIITGSYNPFIYFRF